MEKDEKQIVANDVMLNEVHRMIDEGCEVTIRVKGSSMLPFIVGGRDSVTLIKPANLQKNDIVLAEIQPKHFVLHRIKSIENSTVILMGDGNLRVTEKCQSTDVIGLVAMIIRNEKLIEPTSLTERMMVALWLFFTPVRRILLAVYRRVC